MKNKLFMVIISLVILLLCVYYLSFSIVSNRITKEATAYATDKDGVTHDAKKQKFYDSIWNMPVYKLPFRTFTYKELKDNELHLGLDLQGGMHVTLEISPEDIISGLINHPEDEKVQAALKAARDAKPTSNAAHVEEFFKAYEKANPGASFASLFFGASTHGNIKSGDDNAKVVSSIKTEVESAVERSFTILRNRLDEFGTTSPNIQRLAGSGLIQVEIPGADNPQRIRNLLQRVAKLEFLPLADNQSPFLNKALNDINQLVVAEQALKAKGVVAKTDSTATPADTLSGASQLEKQLANTTSNEDSLLQAGVSPLYALSSPPGAYRYALKDTAKISAIFNRSDVKGILRGQVGAFWGNKTDKQDETDLGLQLYFIDIKSKLKLSGDVVTNARNDQDQYGGPAVSMTMNASGSSAWAKMTRVASEKSPKGRIAIVLDKNVYSAPSVNGEIPNGSSQISGSFTVDEAKDLANVLKAGSLPATCRIVEEAIIGPTLGQSAQREGILSSICGLILVVIFMIAYYSKGGLVANLALLFNIVFMMGVLAQPSLATALTLPGIAGIVLTMGMAVDANVLIYERIKEEMLKGVLLRDAVSKGFDKAFGTILDSHATALITGTCLYFFGQGPIKGFAITLVIGIITSFFTSIYLSRLFIDWMLNTKNAANISFETFLSKMIKKRKYFNFFAHNKMITAVSMGIVIIGFIILGFRGFNLGVDFKGGRSYVVAFHNPVTATDLKVALTESFDGASTEVKNYGGNNVMKVTTAYLIEQEGEQADSVVKQSLIRGIEKQSGLAFSPAHNVTDEKHFVISGSSKVGATVAADIKDSAWKASLISLVGIFIYILFRFKKWQFSAGAIIATVHDALFVIAAFAIADLLGISFEIDQIFIASFLTVIGYSLNDTVIIYDRIRENRANSKSHDRVKLVNDALNDTLSRTIITSGTTLLMALVLLIFGGEVLRGFSFALLIGIIVGTYSSIFIAAPAIIDLEGDPSKEKVPQGA